MLPAVNPLGHLSGEEQKFVLAMADHGNLTEAMVSAGLWSSEYSERDLTAKGKALSREPRIRAAMEYSRATMAAEGRIHLEAMTAFLSSVVQADMTAIFEDDYLVKSLAEIPPELRKMVQSIKRTAVGIEVKFIDKLGAVDRLLKINEFNVNGSTEGAGFTIVVQSLDDAPPDAVVVDNDAD